MDMPGCLPAESVDPRESARGGILTGSLDDFADVNQGLGLAVRKNQGSNRFLVLSLFCLASSRPFFSTYIICQIQYPQSKVGNDLHQVHRHHPDHDEMLHPKRLYQRGSSKFAIDPRHSQMTASLLR